MYSTKSGNTRIISSHHHRPTEPYSTVNTSRQVTQELRAEKQRRQAVNDRMDRKAHSELTKHKHPLRVNVLK